ncbi:hypothetical protein [Spirosoma soli]|uniref:hypothetical protein n=1 Tax=Spirosoma soli TaxID=1770529 RepID=UPI0036D26331
MLLILLVAVQVFIIRNRGLTYVCVFAGCLVLFYVLFWYVDNRFGNQITGYQ